MLGQVPWLGVLPLRNAQSSTGNRTRRPTR
jgi:hypothetical protein